MATAAAIGKRRYEARQKIDRASQRFQVVGLPPLTLPVYNPDKDFENMLQFEAIGDYMETLANHFAPLPDDPEPLEIDEDTEPLEVGKVDPLEPDESLEAIGQEPPLEPDEDGVDTIVFESPKKAVAAKRKG